MKIHTIPTAVAAILTSTALSHGQGSLTPPGAPAPTMHSLDEIWSEIEHLRYLHGELANENAALIEASAVSYRQGQQFIGGVDSLLEGSRIRAPWRGIVPRSVLSNSLSDFHFPKFVPGRDKKVTFSATGDPIVAFVDLAGSSGPEFTVARYNGDSWETESPSPSEIGDSVVQSTWEFLDGIRSTGFAFHDSVSKDLFFNARQLSEITPANSDRIGRGIYPAIAENANGDPIVSYYDTEDFLIKLATRGSDGAWETETVPSPIDSGSQEVVYSVVRVAEDGRIGIAFSFNDLLHYAEKAEGVWTVTDVVATRGSVILPELEFAPSGEPVVSYTNGSTRDIYVGVRDGETWDAIPIERSDVRGTAFRSKIDLEFSPAGTLHAALVSGLNIDEITIARRNPENTAWIFELIDGQGRSPRGPALEFGPDGRPIVTWSVSGDAGPGQREQELKAALGGKEFLESE